MTINAVMVWVFLVGVAFGLIWDVAYHRGWKRGFYEASEIYERLQ